ncbi:hypothetical protein HK104_000115 [Borealophlyctis nickersoniae]|nr:hypothetical protein HK104_000115 [Borealophlyctis nickersoniae]
MSATEALRPFSATTKAEPQFTLFDPVLTNDVINFQVGAPSRDLLPHHFTRRAVEAAMTGPHAQDFLQYGPELGPDVFLEELAAWLTKAYGRVVQNLFTDPSTIVFLEDPTYFLALKIVQDYIPASNVVYVPTDDDGIRVDVLEQQLMQKMGDGSTSSKTDGNRFPFLLYLVPTFNNPKGVTLTAERRATLAELAYRYNMLYVYGCGKAQEREKRNVFSFDPTPSSGRIISNCSFSKLYGPGIRLGWIEAGQGIIQRIRGSGLAASGGGVNHFSAGWMHFAIRLGFLEQQVDHLRTVYTRRLKKMLDTLERELPPAVRISLPRAWGGFFVWLVLPPHVDTETLRQVAIEKEKVAFGPGKWFSGSKGASNCIRLSFAFYDEDVIGDGVERLGRVLRGCVE